MKIIHLTCPVRRVRCNFFDDLFILRRIGEIIFLTKLEFHSDHFLGMQGYIIGHFLTEKGDFRHFKLFVHNSHYESVLLAYIKAI